MKRTFISVFSVILAISLSEGAMGQSVVVAPLTDRQDAMYDFDNIQEGVNKTEKERVGREVQELKASGSSDYKTVLKMARIAGKFEANGYKVSADRFGVHAYPSKGSGVVGKFYDLVKIDPTIASNSIIILKYTQEARSPLNDAIDYVGSEDVKWDEAQRIVKLIRWKNADITSFEGKAAQYDIGGDLQLEEVFYQLKAPLEPETAARLTASGKTDLVEVIHQIN